VFTEGINRAECEDAVLHEPRVLMTCDRLVLMLAHAFCKWPGITVVNGIDCSIQSTIYNIHVAEEDEKGRE
jgi:hypothetical protein